MMQRRSIPAGNASPLQLSGVIKSDYSSYIQRKSRRKRSAGTVLGSLKLWTSTRNGASLLLAVAGLSIFIVSFVFLVTQRISSDFRRTQSHLEWDNENHLPLKALSTIDFQKYTIRINTWKRQETLKVSIEHHSSCPLVAQIQVVWCLDQGPPPRWLVDMDDSDDSVVVLERHEVNSLNERFNILSEPATLGILSLDDDILRPCIAYDWAFDKWTRNPDRMVGYDPRSHVIKEDGSWSYQTLTPTERDNHYSFVLTRCAFLHADYMDWYTKSEAMLPIREFIHENLNCEDIAMSFAISSMTSGKPPLLADFWAMKCTIELDDGAKKISGGDDHLQIREKCVNDFADILQLKDALQSSAIKSYFENGDPASDWNQRPKKELDYMSKIRSKIDGWKEDPLALPDELAAMRLQTADLAYRAGLVEGTVPWKKRFESESDESVE